MRTSFQHDKHTAIVIVLQANMNVKHNYPKDVHKLYIFRFILYIASSPLSSHFFKYEHIKRNNHRKIYPNRRSCLFFSALSLCETFCHRVAALRSLHFCCALQLCGFSSKNRCSAPHLLSDQLAFPLYCDSKSLCACFATCTQASQAGSTLYTVYSNDTYSAPFLMASAASAWMSAS